MKRIILFLSLIFSMTSCSLLIPPKKTPTRVVTQKPKPKRVSQIIPISSFEPKVLVIKDAGKTMKSVSFEVKNNSERDYNWSNNGRYKARIKLFAEDGTVISQDFIFGDTASGTSKVKRYGMEVGEKKIIDSSIEIVKY